MDVLIIDDELAICTSLRDLLVKEGFSADFTTDPRRGIARVGEARVVLLDLRLPGIEGFELLDEIRRSHPRVPVIMVTAMGLAEPAVEAMKRGAFDYIVKPPDQDALLRAVDRALGEAVAEGEVSELFYELPEEIVFRDERTLRLIDEIRWLAPTDMSVLLEGETGVGKEVFARLLHQWSKRAKGPLVKVNCAAIPEGLFESEIFGHEKGAFTGAASSKPGRVELAAGGTLFLDEIGELPALAQAKLLQFLQDRTFERVGGLRTLRADVRIVAATNRALEGDSDRFRRDLYFRIAGERIVIPPLRERPEDIRALADHFLARFAARHERRVCFAPGALDELGSYGWPGNVRELEHALERAVARPGKAEIAPGDMLPRIVPDAPGAGTLRAKRDEMEKVEIEEALRRTGGNRTKAAELLGISRRMLHKKLKKYGLG